MVMLEIHNEKLQHQEKYGNTNYGLINEEENLHQMRKHLQKAKINYE